MTTIARWTVLPLAEKACAKNVILFIGDGCVIPDTTLLE
jgi:alkaline phosphatase